MVNGREHRKLDCSSNSQAVLSLVIPGTSTFTQGDPSLDTHLLKTQDLSIPLSQLHSASNDCVDHVCVCVCVCVCMCVCV